MRLPRVRIKVTVRRTMIAVAVIALVLAAWLEWDRMRAAEFQMSYRSMKYGYSRTSIEHYRFAKERCDEFAEAAENFAALLATATNLLLYLFCTLALVKFVRAGRMSSYGV